MKPILYATALLIGLVVEANFTLFAEQTSSMSSSSTTQSTPENSHSNQDQAQMAAWMIETAQVSKDYVEGLDRGQYEESWAKGDQLFQHTISQQEWAKALNDSRKPLGKVLSRTLKDQRPAMNPHGLPRGAYMVVEYNTSFENAPASGELLTLRQGTDGKWRVLTYQVN